jgi:DNA-binding MarR family transcriptional regulator
MPNFAVECAPVKRSRLLDEIKQTRPFGSLEEEVFLSLTRTADAVLHHLAAALKPDRLSPPQYNVLRILRGARPGGLACGEILSRMVTRAPDLTRLLDRLQRRELVTRRREAHDRRVVTARITRKGLALLEALQEPAVQSQRRALAHLGRGRLRRLARLLDDVRLPPA